MGRRYNLIIESTMRQSATFERTSNELRNLAYAVDADVLAVRPSLSWVGVKARYERARGHVRRRAKHASVQP